MYIPEIALCIKRSLTSINTPVLCRLICFSCTACTYNKTGPPEANATRDDYNNYNIILYNKG